MSATQAAADTSSKSAKGRREKDGSEKVVTLQPLRVSLKHLASLYDSKKAAESAFREAVKKIAEKTGLMSAVVNKLISARAKDTVFDEARKAEQLSMIFSEIGGESGPEQQSFSDTMETGAARPPKKNGNGKGAKNGKDEPQPPIGEGDPPESDALAGTDLEQRPHKDGAMDRYLAGKEAATSAAGKAH